MSENLIEDIKKAEEKSAALIDESVKNAENELMALKGNFSQSLKNLENDFNIKKKEIVQKAQNDTANKFKESNVLESEVSLLNKRTGQNKDDITGFILNKILG